MEQVGNIKSDTVVDISPILTLSPQKFCHPHAIPISFNSTPIDCKPIPMKFIPIPIKSAVLYISTDNLTVYRNQSLKIALCQGQNVHVRSKVLKVTGALKSDTKMHNRSKDH